MGLKVIKIRPLKGIKTVYIGDIIRPFKGLNQLKKTPKGLRKGHHRDVIRPL